jgi:sulfite reductase (NADPH) flavoprotein alpha-component
MNTLSNGREGQMLEMITPANSNDSLLILFATVTGNAERIAHRLAHKVQGCGFTARVMDMARCTPEILTEHGTVLIVASTCGNGEPPDDALPFWEALVHGNGLDLCGLNFSVLALGNLTYEHFCRCGRDFDAALERHGATRLYPRTDCDAEYRQPARRWINGVSEALQRQQNLRDYEQSRHIDAGATKQEQYENIFGEVQAVMLGSSPID